MEKTKKNGELISKFRNNKNIDVENTKQGAILIIEYFSCEIPFEKASFFCMKNWIISMHYSTIFSVPCDVPAENLLLPGTFELNSARLLFIHFFVITRK